MVCSQHEVSENAAKTNNCDIHTNECNKILLSITIAPSNSPFEHVSYIIKAYHMVAKMWRSPSGTGIDHQIY